MNAAVRALVVAVATGILVVAAATAALAHGDARLAAGTTTLAPGESLRATAGLHYHRLAAVVDADGPVVVELVRDATGEVVATAGAATAIDLNRLVRCCDAAPWDDHTLVVTNRGSTPVVAGVRARLVHDDLAVMVDGAESGTGTSVVVLGLAWAALLWRACRRQPHDLSLRRAVIRFAGVAGGVVGLALWGGWRYGVGGAPGLVVGLADLPVLPFNPVVSRATLLVVVAMVAWGSAGLAWARADRAGTGAWWAIGAVLIGSVAVVAVLVTEAYGPSAATWGTAVAAGAPLLAVPVLRHRPAAGTSPALGA